MTTTTQTIAVITCYHEPDYVRARTLRAALGLLPDVEVVVIKNRHQGLLRYPEVIWNIWQTKRQQNIDAYLLTFRGQDILPVVLALAGKTPVIFDEFIVPLAYATQEEHVASPTTWLKHSLAHLGQPLYRRWLQKCRFILTDTSGHATLSSQLNGVDSDKYLALPVGTDETIFKPTVKRQPPTKPFQVFYYSTGMQPLHGVQTVLTTAEILKDQPDIRFVLVGGKRPMRRAVETTQAHGAHIDYYSRLPFNDLAEASHRSLICLGGPFGGTPQALNVITGKTYQFLAAEVVAIIGASPTTAPYFHDKKNSLVIPQADAHALAEAIIWASQHLDKLPSIAAAGRQLYLQEFSVAVIADRLRPLVDQL